MPMAAKDRHMKMAETVSKIFLPNLPAKEDF
jgi:hypothetical protein